MLPWEEEIPPRIRKLIHLGLDLEWMNHTSLVSRFQRPSAQPFFAHWDYVPLTGRWKFIGARAINPVAPGGLISMGARDIEYILQDPELQFVLSATQEENRIKKEKR
ncbi:hypothetical protein ABZ470_23845 [Streptosporangium sp. NPDC020072]|uniref:hypothetical protein n=1 Tax=Streptosporangium sp. NPDC020072 TaxID=3154788 RepID=UPI0034385A0F